MFHTIFGTYLYYWLDGRESEWTPGVGAGQGGLACCDSWGRKESDTTEQLNWTELKFIQNLCCKSHSWPYIWSKLIWKDTCTPVFIAALFTIAKTQKHPKCPDKWIRKRWYMDTVYYSDMEKNEVMPSAATWTDLGIVILIRVRQRKTYIIWYHLYIESKKNDTNEFIYKTEIDSQT